MQASPSAETRPFRQLCAEHGLAATHQRQVLYEVMQTMPGHPSPEEVYARVKELIPAISLATVYKNIHHHMVCSHCKAITDIDEHDLGPLPTLQRLPGGFQAERYAIDVIGIC